MTDGYPCNVCGEFAYRHHVYEATKRCDGCRESLIPVAATLCMKCLGWDRTPQQWARAYVRKQKREATP